MLPDSDKEMIFSRDLGTLSQNLVGIEVTGKGKGHDLVDQGILAMMGAEEVDLSACHDLEGASAHPWCMVFLTSGNDNLGFQPMVVEASLAKKLIEAEMLDLWTSPVDLDRAAGLLASVVSAIWKFPSGTQLRLRHIDNNPVFTAHGRLAN